MFSTTFHSLLTHIYLSILITYHLLFARSPSLGSRTMPIRNALPPWEFLLSASRNSLQSYELCRLGHAANLRKEVAPMLDQWVEEIAAAMLARWVMEHREREIAAASDRDHAPHSEGAALRPIISSRIPRRRTTLRALPRKFSVKVERFAAPNGSRLAALYARLARLSLQHRG